MLRKGGQNLLTRMRVVESACASGPSSTLGGGIQNAVSSMDGCVFGYNLSIDMLIYAGDYMRGCGCMTRDSAGSFRFCLLME
jgi:hypothetical protein